MTVDEGYIRYDIDWTPGPPPDVDAVQELDTWRRPLYKAGLIGEYADSGIGYGNLSVRYAEGGLFLVSGTQTGHLATTTPEHYALVTAVDIDANRVACRGPVKASSEAMTHAAIYALGDHVGAVVHIHSKSLWNRFLGVLPTTDPDVAYGTPGMAREFARLYADAGLDQHGVAVMAGHEEGLISFGPSLEVAARRLLDLTAPGTPEPGKT